jgi:hypothetical protein
VLLPVLLCWLLGPGLLLLLGRLQTMGVVLLLLVR